VPYRHHQGLLQVLVVLPLLLLLLLLLCFQKLIVSR
jgi:hypothetical protein